MSSKFRASMPCTRRAIPAAVLLLALVGCKAAEPPAPATRPAATVTAPAAADAGQAIGQTGIASVWDAASQRGVGFRAVGQEPGWLVEVDRGSAPAMRALLDHGQRELLVPASTALADNGGYNGATAKGESVELRITRAECEDTMSGASFEATTQLHVDGQVLNGCGRFLPENVQQ